MKKQAATKDRVESQIQRILAKAQRFDEERRMAGRHPFFYPVLLRLHQGTQQYSAFTRDISEGGIGLLHSMPIEPQTLTVITRLDSGDEQVELPIRLVWCLPCGEGWYISGGAFEPRDDT